MTTASKILSQAMQNLADLIAACESFQTWCGADEEDLGDPTGIALANTHIHLPLYVEDADDDETARKAKRPLAIVGPGDGFAGSRQAEAEPYFHHEGSFTVIFEDVVTAGSTDRNACLALLNNIGGVLEEIESKAGTASYLTVTGWRQKFAPARMAPETVKEGELDVYQMAVEIAWAEA